jgi:hypothetical protein
MIVNDHIEETNQYNNHDIDTNNNNEVINDIHSDENNQTINLNCNENLENKNNDKLDHVEQNKEVFDFEDFTNTNTKS